MNTASVTNQHFISTVLFPPMTTWFFEFLTRRKRQTSDVNRHHVSNTHAQQNNFQWRQTFNQLYVTDTAVTSTTADNASH